MKSLILVWGSGTTLLGMFDTLSEAETFAYAEIKPIKQKGYTGIYFVRCSVGEAYQDMSEFLYSFNPQDF